MTKKVNRHVTPNPDGTWNNKKEGAQRASSVHNTQAEAEREAIRQSKQEKGEVFIHGKDNKFRDRKSYGNDPRDRKG